MEQSFIFIFLGLGAAITVTLVAYVMGFFKIPIKPYSTAVASELSGRVVCSGVALFAFVKYIITPALLVIGYYMVSGQQLTNEIYQNSKDLQGWFNFTAIPILALAYLIFFLLMKPTNRRLVFGSSKKRFNNLFLGAMTWCLVMPWIFTVSHSLDYVIRLYYPGPGVEQVAISYVRQVAENPTLFWLTAGAVVFVIPVVEESLFRGLLQTWLTPKVGVAFSIVITSLAFALVHYSYDQGVFNLTILSSLFILSLLLGYLKVRQDSLAAPVALHATVNGISLIIILIQERFHELLS